MKTADGYWFDGFNAAEAGLPKDACPLLFDAWPAEAWRQGHDFFQWSRQIPFRSRPGPLQELDKTPADQGRHAYLAGRAIDTCPYGPDSVAARAWRLGWIDQFNIAAKFSEEPPAEAWPAGAAIVVAFGGIVLALLCVGIALAFHQHMPASWLAWIASVR